MPFVITVVKKKYASNKSGREFIQIKIVGALGDDSVEFFSPFYNIMLLT